MDYQGAIMSVLSRIYELWISGTHRHTRLSKSGHQICHMIPLSRAHLGIGVKVGLCVFVSGCLCVWDCGCHYIVPVSIHSASTFDASHLFTLVLPGLLWRGAYLLPFPPQAKLVITFPGRHHSIAIHHYPGLFDYIRRAQWWWQASLTG